MPWDSWSKKDNSTQANPARIIHNRMWGGRRSDVTICCDGGGTAGGAVGIGGGETTADWHLFMNNIVMDSAGGLGFNTHNPDGDGTDNNSIIGNIF